MFQVYLSSHLVLSSMSFFFFLRFYLLIFGERGKKGERDGGKHRCARETSASCTWAAPQARALTGNRTVDRPLCRVMPNQLSHEPTALWSGQNINYF